MSEFPDWVRLGFQNGIAFHANRDRADATDYVRVDRYDELQAQLDALRPVPVDQVPEEWKDNRWVVCWVPGCWQQARWNLLGKCWISVGGRSIRDATRVSLPLPPQEPDNA